jgi:hypothetical protein
MIEHDRRDIPVRRFHDHAHLGSKALGEMSNLGIGFDESESLP